MIRKLRIKFVVVNMSIVTVLLGIILSLTFMFTQARLENRSLQMMQKVATRPTRHDTADETLREGRLLYFVLKIGPEGEPVVVGNSYYSDNDLDNEVFLRDLVDSVQSSERRNGVLKSHNLRFCLVNAPRDQYMVFADISEERVALDGLMQVCVLLGVLGFFAFLGISILLSRWAVKPVDAAMRQQRQFVADASHELKTPLSVLMTNAQLMQSSSCSLVARERCMQGILTMSQQMKRLIEQMLELAQMDACEPQVCDIPVDFSKLVYDAVLCFEPVFFERHLTLQVDGVQPGIQIGGDGEQLRRMLEIFLDNAQKYASPGGQTWVTLQKKGKGCCVLAVSNEGCAIPAADLQQLFKRFYRADKSRKQRGSFGLGLSIAESTVQQHRGKIWAESKQGINSFIVELPRLQ